MARLVCKDFLGIQATIECGFTLKRVRDMTRTYSHDKERLKEQARNKYRSLSEEDKKKKREYGKNRYHNISDEKKQELKEYQKQRYQEVKESKNNNEQNSF